MEADTFKTAKLLTSNLWKIFYGQNNRRVQINHLEQRWSESFTKPLIKDLKKAISSEPKEKRIPSSKDRNKLKILRKTKALRYSRMVNKGGLIHFTIPINYRPKIVESNIPVTQRGTSGADLYGAETMVTPGRTMSKKDELNENSSKNHDTGTARCVTCTASWKYFIDRDLINFNRRQLIKTSFLLRTESAIVNLA